jgi:peptidyl-prolyl cis-trans isomerase C
MVMSCAVRDTVLPKAKGVRVNGVAIPRDLISRETQHHPSKTPAAAWTAAARALVIRELLLQEARRLEIVGEPLSDSDGRRETAEEAAIRTLIAREVRTPEPDEAACRRYYEQNIQRFRLADIFEASHILIAADARDATAYAAAREKVATLCDKLRDNSERFADLARAHSDCPSAAQDGNLGQITSGQTTPEFEQALQRLTPGTISAEPVATRYGFHVIRLERRIEGRTVPYEAAAERIAHYLKESVERLALAQYVARLACRSTIDGVTLADAEALRVH